MAKQRFEDDDIVDDDDEENEEEDEDIEEEEEEPKKKPKPKPIIREIGDMEEEKPQPKKPKAESQPQYIEVPRVVPIEQMLNLIYDQNTQILNLLSKK